MLTLLRHLIRTSTEFISEMSAPTIPTSFDFHLFDFLVYCKGEGRCVSYVYVLYCLDALSHLAIDPS